MATNLFNDFRKEELMKFMLFLAILLVFSCSSPTNEEHSHEEHSHEEHSHEEHSHSMNHSSIETDNGGMSVKISIEKDAMSGVNIRLETNEFKFTPQNVNKAHIDGEGHAHLYINSKKWGRVYSNYIHISKLNAGENIFEVTLNSNTHEDYFFNGTQIKDEVAFNYILD